MKTVTGLTIIILLLTAVSGCGGGSSSSSSSSYTPHISSISPNTVQAAGSSFTLTVNGSNFTTGSYIGIVYSQNISLLATTEVSDQELQAQISSADIQGANTLTIIVQNPGGSQSNSVTLTVTNPVPTLSDFSPRGAAVGTASVTLTVAGTNFVSNTTVDWNGTPLPTAYLGPTEVTATISAFDLTSMQTAQITVVNSGSGGGTSTALYFPVYILINQPANDIVWDNAHQVLYATVPGSASNDANDILSIDPNTGAILSTQPAGSDPDVLALSDDDQYLYVGEDGSAAIQRFILPGLTPDISWNLGSGQFGSYFALDIQVAPGTPHTTAVALGENGVSPSALGGVVIYDDSTPRPVTIPGDGNPLTRSVPCSGGDDTTLYAGDLKNEGWNFYVLSVDSSGATIATVVSAAVFGPIHFDSGTGDIYYDGGGILDTTGTLVGMFQSITNSAGAIAPDSSINRAFQVNAAGGGFEEITLQSYDMTTLQPVASLNAVPVVALEAPRMVRWGSNGVALILNNGISNSGIWLIEGTFVH